MRISKNKSNDVILNKQNMIIISPSHYYFPASEWRLVSPLRNSDGDDDYSTPWT